MKTFLLRGPSVLILILLASLTVHLIFLIENPGTVFNMPEKYNRPYQTYGDTISKYGSYDSARYVGMAFQIMEKGIYAYGSTSSNAYVTPGEPFYLVANFSIAKYFQVDHLLLTRICSMILSIATIALIYFLTMELFEKKGIGLLAALFYATYFSPLHYFRAILTEIPAIFVFIFALYAFVKAIKYESYPWHVIFGLAFSMGIMFRPSPAPLLIIGIIIVLRKHTIKDSLKIGLLWLIGPILIILPWAIRNLIVLQHSYIFSSHSGNPFLEGTNPYFLEKLSSLDLSARARSLSLSKNQYAMQRIIEGLHTQANLWISWFTVGKPMVLFGRPAGWPYYSPQFNSWTLWVYAQHFFVIFSGMLTGLICSKNKQVKALFILILGYVFISLFFVPKDRYGFFIMPLFCILSAYGVVAITIKIMKQ